MAEQENSCVLATDFDGTVIQRDFFWHIIDRILTEEDIEPWRDYEADRITHFDALNLIFQKIHVSTEELHKLIYEIPIEECFADTMRVCKEKSIPVYIISAGADYYIRLILDALGIKDSINIISNESKYNKEDGLVMNKLPETSVFYSENYGIDKAGVIKFLKSKYEKVIFAGDGVPDFPAAEHADVVFARGALLELCSKNNLETYSLDSYCNVLEYLKNNQ